MLLLQFVFFFLVTLPPHAAPKLTNSRVRSRKKGFLTTKKSRRLDSSDYLGGDDDYKDSNDFLDNLQDLKKDRDWRFLHLIVEGSYFKNPPGQQFRPGDVLTGYNFLLNNRGDQIGSSIQTCILTTNWVCTWNLFSASITKSGCDIMAQGYFIRGDQNTFGIPVEQFIAITGGTGPCRGIVGEIKISPRALQNPPPLWDYEMYYKIRH